MFSSIPKSVHFCNKTDREFQHRYKSWNEVVFEFLVPSKFKTEDIPSTGQTIIISIEMAVIDDGSA